MSHPSNPTSPTSPDPDQATHTFPRGKEDTDQPTAPPAPVQPIERTTVATLPPGTGWTLRLHVHPLPIELDLVCQHCGNGYTLNLDERGNGALVRLILDTHQHPQEP